MTEAQVLALINLYIIANGNNEITANVLRPVLVAMLEQPNNKVGDLGSLATTDQSSIVAAINEIVNSGSSGFDIHTGTADPNVTPPGSFGIGDWYVRNGTSLYQNNGSSWILLTAGVGTTNLSTSGDATTRTVASDTGTDAVIPLGNGTEAGVTLNNFSTAEKDKLEGVEVSTKEEFTWTTGPFTFTLSRTPTNVDVYVGRVWQFLDDDYIITGDEVTILYDLEVGEKVTVRLY
jgi:hypothetical protein